MTAFDHAAHLRLAWDYLEKFPTATAIEHCTAALRNLTERLGVPDKYHETVSWFFMIVLADRRACSPGTDWQTFRERNRDLFEEGKALLERYYSPQCLASEAARQRFLLPDRCRVRKPPAVLIKY